MIGKVTKKHPQIKIVATTLREVHSTNRHSWSAVAWIDGKTYRAPECELDVIDRVGGGDGYAAGFFYGLLADETSEEASSWDGRTVLCSRLSQATPRWPLWSKSVLSLKAARPASSANLSCPR